MDSFVLLPSDTIWRMSQKCQLLLEKLGGVAVN